MTTPTPQLEAEVGDEVILQCNYTMVLHTSQFAISWYKISKTFPNGSPIIDDSATHIWESHLGEPGDPKLIDVDDLYHYVNQSIPIASGHSIKIRHMTLQSEGMYACIVQPEYGDRQGDAVINLTVLGKYSSGKTC